MIPLTGTLDVGALAEELDTLPATVHHAITKLVADGLVARDPERGHVVIPVTAAGSEQAFDARCAMELGAAASTIGRLPPEPVAALRRLMEDAEPLVSGGRFVDVDAYTRSNQAFHRAIIGLTGNPTLLDAHHRVGVAGLMVSLLREGSAARQEILDDHRAIVEAFERGSLPDAVAVITRHNETAKETTRRNPGRRQRTLTESVPRFACTGGSDGG